MKKCLGLILLLLASCSVMRDKDSNADARSSSIVFVLMEMHRDTADGRNVIQLLSKTESNGSFKNVPTGAVVSENYLTVYVYRNNRLVDTLMLEHPLYKHFEYLDENNNFAVKDTVLDRADFFIRLQTRGSSNEIRVLETIKNKAGEELTTIKL